MASSLSKMSDYLLFVDTETSGLPVDWRRPYAAAGNWPYLAQLAWAVYTREGQPVAAESHYLQVPAGVMSPAAVAIHGLTPAFLGARGEAAEVVLAHFSAALQRYQPLVVGHFMALDFHVIGAACYRAGLANPLLGRPTFCTMTTTARFVRHARQRYLPLGELYERLFGRPLLGQHAAAVDARAAAECFFALWQRGDITEQTLAAQAPLREPVAAAAPARGGWPRAAWLGGVGLLFLLLLLWHWYG